MKPNDSALIVAANLGDTATLRGEIERLQKENELLRRALETYKDAFHKSIVWVDNEKRNNRLCEACEKADALLALANT